MPYDVVGISAIMPNVGKVEEDVRADPAAPAEGHDRRRRAHRQRARTCAIAIDADHVVRGEGVRWFRAFLGEDARRADPPSADRLRLRHAHDGRPLRRRTPGDAPPRSSPRSAARWAATSARPRPCSAARASPSTSTRPATSCSTSCASSSRASSVRVVLRDGRELPAPPQARPAAAGADGASTTRPGRSTSSARPTCCGRTRSSNWSAWASPGSGWASRAKTASTRKLNGTDTLRAGRASCSRTASACSARRSSAWKSTRRRTSTRRSTTPSRTTPTSTSSCSTRRSRHAAVRRAPGEGHAAGRATSAPTPTSTASCASTTATRRSATARRRSSCCARSTATSR